MKNNIKEQINDLKKYINNININDISKEELLYIKNEFNKIYEALLIFLIEKKDRYYGYIIINMQLEINFYKDIIAGVTILDKNPIVITINPFLFLEFNIKEMLFILCHEIEHLVLNHPSEVLRLNPSMDPEKTKLLNYAMDCSINERLKYMINNYNENYISCPNDIIDIKFIKKLVPKQNVKKLESYLYYYNLIKDIKNPQKNINFGLKGTKNQNETKNIITKSNSCHGGEFAFELKGDSSFVEEVTKNFVRQAFDSITERNRGLLPLYQQENIERLLCPPKINWKVVLKHYMGNIPVPYKTTKMRLNRRQPLRFDLSGKIMDRTVKLVVAIDTSGSMSNKDIKNVMIEIFNIVKNMKYEITIIECDAEINKIYRAKSIKDVSTKVNGRGGTSFIPVIEYLNKHPYYRDSVLVYFTDGFGDFEIPRPMVYKVLWVVLFNENNLSLEEPYGQIKKLE